MPVPAPTWMAGRRVGGQRKHGRVSTKGSTLQYPDPYYALALCWAPLWGTHGSMVSSRYTVNLDRTRLDCASTLTLAAHGHAYDPLQFLNCTMSSMVLRYIPPPG